MDTLVTGCLKIILEQYAEPMIKGIVQLSKDEWEKFKIDFDIVFIEYVKNAYEKYSKIKTLLYRTEPKFIYDFFEVPTLMKNEHKYFDVDNVDDIINISKYIIIQGTGGIGKSTLMKHLFISELHNKNLIPIFIELKDINDMKEEYEINDLIFDKLSNLGSKLNKAYFEYALKSGCFLFLLDGYDEILSSKKDYFFKKLDSFCDKYSENYYIISSRPYSEFVEFQRFTILSTCLLSKIQATSLINKIEFDVEIKSRFVKALDEELYEKHESFASNPLLLNIMLMTFDNYAEIPEKLHLFYANAFEALYSKHDATKAGYRREMRSNLSYDSFKNVFAYFCFITYAQGKLEFSYDDLVGILKKVVDSKVSFKINEYIYDLVNSMCILNKEGLNYKFAHRSFQEYFTAFFLKELTDDAMKQMGMQLINIDIYRATHDDVFYMLCDMAENRFEKNILLPMINDIEQTCNEGKYNFYFTNIVQGIRFSPAPDDEGIVLWLTRNFGEDNRFSFIYHFANHYVEYSEERNTRVRKGSDELLKYLTQTTGYDINEKVELKEILKDNIMYDLIRKTWLGELINIIVNLRDKLEKKQTDEQFDLSLLISAD